MFCGRQARRYLGYSMSKTCELVITQGIVTFSLTASLQKDNLLVFIDYILQYFPFTHPQGSLDISLRTLPFLIYDNGPKNP